MKDPDDYLVRAVEVIDELVIGGEGVVLVSVETGGRVVRLSELGLAVRTLAREGLPLSRLSTHLTAEFGPPENENAAIAVLQIVKELAAQGLVEVLPAGESRSGER